MRSLKMFRFFGLALILLTVSSCQKVIRSDYTHEINQRFYAMKEQLEQKAKAGQITWVQAEQQVRDVDKRIKEKFDATGALHSWKYDSDDEEYYAYCIFLAEKLDQKQITFAEFDAKRVERLNEIQTRRQGLNTQQQLLNSQQQLLIQNSQMQQQNNVNKQLLKEDLRCTSTVWGQTVNTTCR